MQLEQKVESFFKNLTRFLPFQGSADPNQQIFDMNFFKDNQVFKNLLEKIGELKQQATDITNSFGFLIDEHMAGDHEFINNSGPAGRHNFEFWATWGPDNILEWANPLAGRFLTNRLNGYITIGKLCEKVLVQGTLELLYFDEQKIRYTFDFNANGTDYRYIGEKIKISPFNLPYSHTTCFGTVTEKKTGKVISKSITHFNLDELQPFLNSLRLTRV